MSSTPIPPPAPTLTRVPSGIQGLDQITGGGFPAGSMTLVCGSAGSGKTLCGLAFVLHGARIHAEPGLFIAADQPPDHLRHAVTTYGVDPFALEHAGLLTFAPLPPELPATTASGSRPIEQLLSYLERLLETSAARRLVLDPLDTLLARFGDPSAPRAWLHRLIDWLRQRRVTTLATAERGERSLTRLGLAEHLADCVVALDYRLTSQNAVRRARVVKYRGFAHTTAEYPLFFSAHGLDIDPLTAIDLNYRVSDDRISTGIPQLDEMLGGQGYYRGSSILLSGTPGTGKTSMAAAFVAAACERGERALYFTFEEAPAQIIRNLQGVGIRLRPWLDAGVLQIIGARPTPASLTLHLAELRHRVHTFGASIVVIDPITCFQRTGEPIDVTLLLLRLLDQLKSAQITTLCVSLSTGGNSVEQTDVDVSSLIDTWLLLRNLEANGERNRGLYVLKARGIAHSNQIRELIISEEGLALTEVYTGAGTVLTGSARLAEEAREQIEAVLHRQELERRELALEHRRRSLNAQIAALEAELAAEEATVQQLADHEALQERLTRDLRGALQRMRLAHGGGPEQRRRNP